MGQTLPEIKSINDVFNLIEANKEFLKRQIEMRSKLNVKNSKGKTPTRSVNPNIFHRNIGKEKRK